MTVAVTKQIALVRHGLPNRIEGVLKPDPGLTESGVRQARAVAEAMALLPVSSIASSKLTRARQTASPTAETTGISVDIHVDLAEFDNGADFYIPIEDMIAESDPRLDQWRGLMTQPDMAGAFAEFRRTATAAVDRVAGNSPAGVTVIFSHGGVIGACVAKALGETHVSLDEPHYGSITRITIESDDRWKLNTYNEIHHIERIAAREEERNELSR